MRPLSSMALLACPQMVVAVVAGAMESACGSHDPASDNTQRAAALRKAQPWPAVDDMVVVPPGKAWIHLTNCSEGTTELRHSDMFDRTSLYPGEDSKFRFEQSLPTFSVDRYPVLFDDYLRCVDASECSFQVSG